MIMVQSFDNQSYILFNLDNESEEKEQQEEEEEINPKTFKEAHHSFIHFPSCYVHVDRVSFGILTRFHSKKLEDY